MAAAALATPPAVDYAATRLVPLADLHPAPWNPRTLRDARFVELCASISADPQFLWDRPVLARPDGEVFAGNMRLRAAEHLGWPAVPARLVDIPEALAQVRGLRDNNQWGEWEYESLSGLLVALQDDPAIDLATLGFAPAELEPLLAATWTPAAIDDAATFERDGGPSLGAPIVVTTEQRETIDRAIARVREQCGDPDTSEGRCLELMAGDWLSGQATDYEREHARAD
jgi:hypothetical protein